MWHTLLIAGHAVTGMLALLAGCLTLRRRPLFATYLWSLVAMVVFLVLAIAAQWTTLDTQTRLLFAGFVVLAMVMVWRADRARRIRPTAAAAPSASYVEHIGFTLVALGVAFIVVLVLDLGAPAWLVVAVGVVGSLAGHVVLRAARERLVGPRSPRDTLVAGRPPAGR